MTTATIKLDLDAVLPVLREVVEAQPDRVVSVCEYFDPNTGQPDCVIGHVFAKLGVKPTPDWIDDYNEARLQHLVYTSTGLSQLGVELSFDAFHLLQDAQDVQDGRSFTLHSGVQSEGKAWSNIVPVIDHYSRQLANA